MGVAALKAIGDREHCRRGTPPAGLGDSAAARAPALDLSMLSGTQIASSPARRAGPARDAPIGWSAAAGGLEVRRHLGRVAAAAGDLGGHLAQAFEARELASNMKVSPIFSPWMKFSSSQRPAAEETDPSSASAPGR